MSFPSVPTAAGQVIPGIQRSNIRFGPIDFDPCALFDVGSLAWKICKGIDTSPTPPTFDPTPPTQCGPGFTWSAIFKQCLSNDPNVPNPDPVPDQIPSPAETGTSIHGMNGHADTIPFQREIRRRVCPPGAVLGKKGWCHTKISNKDRMYPKPRKALGTPGELNAVTTSKKFSRRLLANQKSLKETARNLAKAGGIKLGGRC